MTVLAQSGDEASMVALPTPAPRHATGSLRRGGASLLLAAIRMACGRRTFGTAARGPILAPDRPQMLGRDASEQPFKARNIRGISGDVPPQVPDASPVDGLTMTILLASMPG